MIQTIEQVFPNEIAMNIFKFCSHPCAAMIKAATHLSTFIRHEGYWDNLQHIIKCRKNTN